MAFPLTRGSAQATVTFGASLPSGAPAPQARIIHGIRPQSLGATTTNIFYAAVTVNASVTIAQSPTFSLTFPSGILNGYAYIAFYDPTNAAAGWNAISGPQTASGTSLQFPNFVNLANAVTLAPGQTYIYAIVESGTPLPTPTPIPTLPPGNGTALSGPSTAPNGAWAATALANNLQFPVQSGYDGTGTTVAVVIDSNILQSDLSTYLSYNQTPLTSRTITVEPVDGASGASEPGQGEATLDVETIAGLAPGANIIIYQIPSLSGQYIVDAYNQILSDKKAAVVSSSFGGCEPTNINNSTEATIFQQGAQSGIAFVASSGDQGNECYTGGTPQYVTGANYPASDPNVTGIGGTETLRPSYTLTSTVVWNDSSCSSGQCAGGGGVSQYFALPSYQQGVSGLTSTQYRNVPDVSMPAEANGVYENGAWGAMNGTSWSAPEYAALMAEVYQYCGSGFQAPTSLPYYVASTSKTAFIDVTSGNDQFSGSSPFYTASAGYDNASGIGVPIGMTFANTICPNRVPAAAARRNAPMTMAQRAAEGPYTLDVTPRVGGLADIGERAPNRLTRIQLVMRPTTSLNTDEQTVVATLQQAGFTVTKRFANHLVVDAEAPAGTIERFFSTQMHDVSQGRYGMRYMTTGPVTVPASIAPYIAGLNLDDLVTMKVPR